MWRTRVGRLATAALSLALIAGVPVTVSAVAEPPAESTRAVLDTLRVAQPAAASGFDRRVVGAWRDADRNCRDSRAEVLARDSTVAARGCVISSGRWVSAFDGVSTTSAAGLRVARLVPLTAAWSAGGSRWTAARWRAYANDLGYRQALVATTPASIADRAGRDPSVWLPRYRPCTYGAAWVAVKARWKLTVSPGERAALGRLLDSCPAVPVERATTAPDATTGTTSRFGAPLDVDPDNRYVAEAAKLSPTDPALPAVRALAKFPVSNWIVESAGARQIVQSRVDAAASRGGIAVITLYNIPHRDQGAYAEGGAATAAEYRQYVRDVVAGLGSRRAVVVVEPDALGMGLRLSPAIQAERIDLLAYATRTIAAQGSWVYVDVGNNWPSAEVQASLLRQVGIDRAAGFALNVSTFRPLAEMTARGHAISDALGTPTHFIIDTSRNGVRSESYDWCNPMPRGVGHRPTTVTGDPLVDAYLWVKPPGDSDGPCNGGPASGVFWPAYARDLVANGRLD